jgi:hypothetical protein
MYCSWSKAEKLYDIATSAMHTLAKARQHAAVPIPDVPDTEPSCTDLELVEVQTVDISELNVHSSQTYQVYEETAANTSTVGVLPCDFINRFLAIFASFRGGNHVYLRRYVQKLCELSLFDE